MHPGGLAPPWTEEEIAGKAKVLAVVREMEALKVGDLVPVCTPMSKMAELTDYWGYYGSDDVVLNQSSVFFQVADILLFMVGTGEESKLKAKSAIPARNVSGKVVANTCPCISAVASADFAMARCSMIDLSLFATAVAIAIVDR